MIEPATTKIAKAEMIIPRIASMELSLGALAVVAGDG